MHCYDYWKSVNGEQEVSEDQRRLNFVRLVVALIRNSPEDARKELFTTEQRSNLASLFGTWSPSMTTEFSTLSCMALIGRCSVLIAGTVELDQRFSLWLSRLLLLEENEQITAAVENITAIKSAGSVDALIIEFVSALLRANRDQLYIFSTELIHRCYHADAQIVNQRAFLALASVIGSEGWEGVELEQIEQIKVPLIVLSLANLSNESSQVSQAAQLFSQVLAKYLSATGENIESISSDLYPAMLAARLSSFTYPVIAEIFSRLQPRVIGVDDSRRVELDPLDQHNVAFVDNSLNFFYESRLLNLLIPWLKNVRLDGNCVSAESLFILNNLLYCSHRFSKRHPTATRHIWSALASNESNAMASINCLAALARLDNLDASIHALLQDVVGEICLQAPPAFECIVSNLTNHGPVPYQVQPAADSPHWTVKKSKSDSPNGSVNSAKVESSLVVRERRTKTATAIELNNVRKPTSLVIRDRAVSNRDIYHSSGDQTDTTFDSHKYYHLPFSMLLPDRFHSSKSSLGSITLLFIPHLLNDRRRRHDSVRPTIPSILVSSILYLDSSVTEIRDAARLSLLGLAHRQLMSSELNEGARVLLQQLENRGQLLNENSGQCIDSGYSTMSGEPSDLASPMSYESAVSSVSASSGQSSLGMVHYLCTTRKFWIKELASPSFLPSSLRSSLQLKQLSESLLAVFGHNLRGDLAELTISSAINSPSQPITCRALQLYRSLLLPLTERILSKLIAKLSEIVADPHEEKQAAVLEILDTFSMDIQTRTKNSDKLAVKDLASDSGSATVPKSHNRQQSGHRRAGSIFGNEFKNKENKLEIKSISAGAILSEKEKRSKVAQADEVDMPDEDVRILTIMVQVAVALLYSDYEHEYRTALKLISLINQIVPLRHLVRWKKKINGENPTEGLQKMLWKGLTKEKDKDAEVPDLETEVFQVLIETLPSANTITTNGLSIQLCSLLPRLIEKYSSVETFEEIAARKAAAALRKAVAEGGASLNRSETEAGESLQKVFSLYAAGEYKQGETNWLSAVCKYLHEFNPIAIDDQLKFYLSLMDSRDCPIWLCSAGAAVIRFLLQHCMASHYPPASLNSVVHSLTKIAQQPNKNKQWPLMMENSLAALQSIVGRAATLFSPEDVIRPHSPIYSTIMPGRVLDFEVNYDEVEVERRQVTHWKRHSSGREVRKKLRFIVHESSVVTHRGSSSENVTGVGIIGVDGESDGTASKVNLASSISESNQGTSAAEEIEEDSKAPDELKDFDFLYEEHPSIQPGVDYLYELDDYPNDDFYISTKQFKNNDSAHDTEKEIDGAEEKDGPEHVCDEIDLRHPNEIDLRPNVIDLRPGQTLPRIFDIDDDIDRKMMKKSVRKKRHHKILVETDGNSSDTSNNSLRRPHNTYSHIRPNSIDISVRSPQQPLRTPRPKSHVYLSQHSGHASTYSDVTIRPNSSMSDATFSELDLPWCATLPIAPPLRAQWQRLIESGETIKALSIFPNIWNSLRVSTNWILTTTQEQLHQKQTNSKGNHVYHCLDNFYFMEHRKSTYFPNII